jgi:hypothetical protein
MFRQATCVHIEKTFYFQEFMKNNIEEGRTIYNCMALDLSHFTHLRIYHVGTVDGTTTTSQPSYLK